MKKNSRGRDVQSKQKKTRALTLSRETVRVLSDADLAGAAGGSGCDTGTVPTRSDATNGTSAG